MMKAFLKWPPVWIGFCGFVLYLIYLNLWRSDGFSGVVVDAAGRPVKDAAVVLVWKAHNEYGGTYTLRLIERVTGSDGAFTFPEWGPEISPQRFSMVAASQPALWIVADGFLPSIVMSDYGMRATAARQYDLSPRFTDRKFVMQSLPPAPDRKAMLLIEGQAILARSFDRGLYGCIWDLAPNFSEAFERLERSAGATFPSFLGKKPNGCGAQ